MARAVFVVLVSLTTYVASQSIPGASLFTGGGVPGGNYQLVDDYRPETFFSKFNYYNVRSMVKKMGLNTYHCTVV